MTDTLTSATFETLLVGNASKKNYKNIPYYRDGSYYVILRSDDAATKVDAEENQDLRDRAVTRFIQHFFPEFYSFMGNQAEFLEESEAQEIAPYEQYYTELRTLLENDLIVDKFVLHPGPIKNKIIFRTTYDLYDLRQEYDEGDLEADPPIEGKLPSFIVARTVLNRKLERDPVAASVTTTHFQNIATQKEGLPKALNAFGPLLHQLQQSQGTPGMDSMQLGVNKIVKKVTDTVHDSINWTKERQSFYDTDYFTVTFNADTEIIGISFFVVATEAGAVQEAKIGYITNIRFNPLFKDRFALFLLKNQQELLDDSMDPSLAGQQNSVLDFLARLGLDDSVGFGQALTGDAVYGLDSTPAGIGGVGPFAIPPRNTDDYVEPSEYSFEAILYAHLGAQGLLEGIQDPDQVNRTREMMDDPVFKAKIAQSQQARRINTTVQVLDVMSDFANMDFFNVMNQTKEGRKINKVLSSFGIQDLAMEALMCITLGIGSSIAKITDSVRDSIVNGASVSFNSPPTPPSMQFDLERPSFDSIKIGSYFSITGDPPLKKRIVDMLLGVIAQAAFEVIKGLAEFIKFNCGDILNGDRGAVDCGEIIKNKNQMAVPSFPNLPELLANLSDKYGLSLDDTYDYMSDVSVILTPIELCRLLNEPGLVTEETIENILMFNEEYPEEAVRLNLDTRTKIISFFQSMTSNIDTTTLCNEIVQDTLLAAVEGCEICLDQGTIFDMQPGIEALLDLAENGFQPPPPAPPNLLCPDHDSYLSNPIAEITIPNLFNQFMDTAAIYMAGSLEGARTSLLEPYVVSSIPEGVLSACSASNVELPHAEVNPASLNVIGDVLDFMQELTDPDQLNLAENCPDISGPKFQELVDNVEVIVAAVQAAMTEIPGAIDEIRDKIDSVRDDIGSGTQGVPHTEYKFPTRFTNEFSQAILVNELNVSSDELTFEGIATSGAINSYETGFVGGGWYRFGGPNDNGTVFDFTFAAATGSYPGDYVRVSYPPWSDTPGEDIPLTLEYSLPSLGAPAAQLGSAPIGMPRGTLYGSAISGSASLTEPWTALLGEDSGYVYEQIALNPYIYRFISPLWSPPAATEEEEATETDIDPELTLSNLVGEIHPTAYTGVIRGIYDYIMDNGSFSMGGPKGINNLNLFKNNTKCTPENIGDLFDADGIIDQMQKEFAAAACFDGGSSKDKVQNSLYFGFINMLIQAAIDEFIVSNIIVLRAFRMDDVLNPIYPYKEFIIDSVIASVNQILLDGNSNVEREIFNYFDRRSKRPSTAELGGFTYSFAPTQVVPGFEAPDFELNNVAMIRFMVTERLGYTWLDDSGTQRSTFQAINNILDPTNTTKSFQDILLEDVLFSGPESFTTNNYVDSQDALDHAAEEHLHWHDSHQDWTTHRNENRDREPGQPGYVDEHNEGGDTSYPGEHHHPDFPALGPSLYGNATSLGILPDYREGAPGDTVFPRKLYIEDNTAAGIFYLKVQNLATNDESSILGTGGKVLLSWPYPEGGLVGSGPATTQALKFAFIKAQPDYQLFIHQAFNIHACFMVPLVHNLYLTNRYFPDVRNSFTSVKRAIIHMFNMTERTNEAPLLAPRNAGFSNTLANNGQQDMGAMALEIFLKFLRDTPIQILKGLVELIDPHVAITKLIKDITGSVFVEITKGIQTALPQNLKDQGITGEQVLAFLFCLYNIGNASAGAAAAAQTLGPIANEGDQILFGPKLELAGMDFTGTVMGMFMIPPSPLGLVYLLIRWLESLADDEANDTGEEEIESATDPEDSSCPEGTTDLDTVYTE